MEFVTWCHLSKQGNSYHLYCHSRVVSNPKRTVGLRSLRRQQFSMYSQHLSQQLLLQEYPHWNKLDKRTRKATTHLPLIKDTSLTFLTINVRHHHSNVFNVLVLVFFVDYWYHFVCFWSLFFLSSRQDHWKTMAEKTSSVNIHVLHLPTYSSTHYVIFHHTNR